MSLLLKKLNQASAQNADDNKPAEQSTPAQSATTGAQPPKRESAQPASGGESPKPAPAITTPPPAPAPKPATAAPAGATPATSATSAPAENNSRPRLCRRLKPFLPKSQIFMPNATPAPAGATPATFTTNNLLTTPFPLYRHSRVGGNPPFCHFAICAKAQTAIYRRKWQTPCGGKAAGNSPQGGEC